MERDGGNTKAAYLVHWNYVWWHILEECVSLVEVMFLYSFLGFAFDGGIWLDLGMKSHSL